MVEKEYLYPNSSINILPGDVLYSTIGRSTYYVGHAVIVGIDYLMKESIPGKPSGHTLTTTQFWRRHRSGDKITLLRAKTGAEKAALWATNNLHLVKNYSVLATNINTIKNNYCSKWIIQAYYFGANVKLTKLLNSFIPPQYLLRSKNLDKIALFSIE